MGFAGISVLPTPFIRQHGFRRISILPTPFFVNMGFAGVSVLPILLLTSWVLPVVIFL
jgi:hypothetical protein